MSRGNLAPPRRSFKLLGHKLNILPSPINTRVRAYLKKVSIYNSELFPPLCRQKPATERKKQTQSSTNQRRRDARPRASAQALPSTAAPVGAGYILPATKPDPSIAALSRRRCARQNRRTKKESVGDEAPVPHSRTAGNLPLLNWTQGLLPAPPLTPAPASPPAPAAPNFPPLP